MIMGLLFNIELWYYEIGILQFSLAIILIFKRARDPSEFNLKVLTHLHPTTFFLVEVGPTLIIL